MQFNLTRKCRITQTQSCTSLFVLGGIFLFCYFKIIYVYKWHLCLCNVDTWVDYVRPRTNQHLLIYENKTSFSIVVFFVTTQMIIHYLNHLVKGAVYLIFYDKIEACQVSLRVDLSIMKFAQVHFVKPSIFSNIKFAYSVLFQMRMLFEYFQLIYIIGEYNLVWDQMWKCWILSKLCLF